MSKWRELCEKLIPTFTKPVEILNMSSHQHSAAKGKEMDKGLEGGCEKDSLHV